MKTLFFGEVDAGDGSVVLMDGGIHGVQGHTVIAPTAGAASWTRTLDGFRPVGRPGSGSFELTSDERALIERARTALEELTMERPKVAFFHPPNFGPPRWSWVIAARVGGSVRVLEGGEVASPGTLTPLEIRDVLDWLRRRVDELSEAP
jgi:hypothetical protein